MNKNIRNNITNIHSIISKNLDDINNALVKRKRDIDYRDVLLLLCTKSFSGDSYDNIGCSLDIQNVNTASKTAFIKKRKLLTYERINKINTNLLDFIYKKQTDGRILAVDGTHVVLNKCLAKHGFPLSDNKFYATGLISCIYDIDTKITINYNLVKHKNERAAFLEQMGYLKRDDTVIFDRGYYSEELIKRLTDNGINYIFRMKKDSRYVKRLNRSKLNSLNVVINISKQPGGVFCLINRKTPPGHSENKYSGEVFKI